MDAYVGFESIREVSSVIAFVRAAGDGWAVFRGWRMVCSWACRLGFVGEGRVGSMRVDEWVVEGWLRRRERV